jgi:deoxyadenosine/deoxycytidine kinase
MLILDGTIGSDIAAFLARMQEDTLNCEIVLYEDWIKHASCNSHDHDRPDGIISLRVMPEIAHARLQKRNLQTKSDLTLDYIKHVYTQKEQLFIENKNSQKDLQDLSVLVLNGNIDFQTDFSQFYNHLFYIKRFVKQIQDKKDLALGIYKEKPAHKHCC